MVGVGRGWGGWGAFMCNSDNAEAQWTPTKESAQKAKVCVCRKLTCTEKKIVPMNPGEENCPHELWRRKLSPWTLEKKIVPMIPGEENCPRKLWRRKLSPWTLEKKIVPMNSGEENCPHEPWRRKLSPWTLEKKIVPMNSGEENCPHELWRRKFSPWTLEKKILPMNSGEENSPHEPWRRKLSPWTLEKKIVRMNAEEENSPHGSCQGENLWRDHDHASNAVPLSYIPTSTVQSYEGDGVYKSTNEIWWNSHSDTEHSSMGRAADAIVQASSGWVAMVTACCWWRGWLVQHFAQHFHT